MLVLLLASDGVDASILLLSAFVLLFVLCGDDCDAVDLLLLGSLP